MQSDRPISSIRGKAIEIASPQATSKSTKQSRNRFRRPSQKLFGGRKLRNRQVKNFLTVTLLALGVPIVLMGDEVRRTQRGEQQRLQSGLRNQLVRSAYPHKGSSAAEG